ncbi:hypothetical protein GCM10011521_16440 [Arenimonas soli]|uniref:Uncharacterized protein n=1 Tax=Arenimonas soli TaxID=2269504 RepID=A0ABQ1HIB9_9GAMM|nr:hypothetical protein [Arenimonas soli]GGA78939.1 hypothetical protein GCM10011521_16440 [Arenimonas soli]
MKTSITLCCFLGLLCSRLAFACELPPDNAYYVNAMQEERALTRDALGRSDQVFIGKVTSIQAGPETPGPGERMSAVEVEIVEALVGTPVAGTALSLSARLHHQIAGCFGNEAFWDDQVEVGGSYIFFVSGGRILSASPPARSWKKLGLSGQRELVLALSKRPDET